MTISWRNIERLVFILTVLVGIIFHFRDKAKMEATTEVKIVVHDADIAEIKAKLERNEQYWLEQKEVNGAFIQYLNLDIEP